MITNYRKAWLDYRKTDDFKTSNEAMKEKGIGHKYRRSILMGAFGAGWLATGKKITWIRNS